MTKISWDNLPISFEGNLIMYLFTLIPQAYQKSFTVRVFCFSFCLCAFSVPCVYVQWPMSGVRCPMSNSSVSDPVSGNLSHRAGRVLCNPAVKSLRIWNDEHFKNFIIRWSDLMLKKVLKNLKKKRKETNHIEGGTSKETNMHYKKPHQASACEICVSETRWLSERTSKSNTWHKNMHKKKKIDLS